jgi:hypothetical protein
VLGICGPPTLKVAATDTTRARVPLLRMAPLRVGACRMAPLRIGACRRCRCLSLGNVQGALRIGDTQVVSRATLTAPHIRSRIRRRLRARSSGDSRGHATTGENVANSLRSSRQELCPPHGDEPVMKSGVPLRGQSGDTLKTHEKVLCSRVYTLKSNTGHMQLQNKLLCTAVHRVLVELRCDKELQIFTAHEEYWNVSTLSPMTGGRVNSASSTSKVEPRVETDPCPHGILPS